MDLLKFSLGLFVFLFNIFLKVSNKIAFIASTILLSLSFFIGAIFSNNGILQIGTFFEIVGVATLIRLILIRQNAKVFLNKTKTFVFYFLFILIQFIQNVFQFAFQNIPFNQDTLTIVNPWGLTISFIFIFCYNSKSLLAYVDTIFFRSIILFSSALFILLVFMVKLGLLTGNTSKVIENLGGIGLKNCSTNETALYALCSIVYFLHYIQEKKIRSFAVLFIVLNCIVIALTQSRLGIGLLAIVALVYAYAITKRRGLQILLGLIGMLLLLFPLLYKFAGIFENRTKVDEIGRINYSPLAQALGTTFSGRLLIWPAYIGQFFIQVKTDILKLFTGVGFIDLPQFYRASYLYINRDSFALKNIQFYPLHSDVLLVFITGGLIGIFLLFSNYFFAIKKIITNFSFLSFSFCIIALSFSLVDMLSYSPYSSLLIGLGISYSLQGVQKISIIKMTREIEETSVL